MGSRSPALSAKGRQHVPGYVLESFSDRSAVRHDVEKRVVGAGIPHGFQHVHQSARADVVANLDVFGRGRRIILQLDAQRHAEAAELSACGATAVRHMA